MVVKSGKSTVHPVTMWQRYLLDQDADPGCDASLRAFWVLAQAFLVHPGVDARRLRRAVEKLHARHDGLRMTFDRVKGQWRAVIGPPDRPEIRQIDLGDVDDATFQSEIKAIANAPMPLVNHPLTEMVVVKCGARGDALITRVHHALTDGHGLVVLTEDMLKFLIGLPILKPAIGHAEYLAKFENPPPHRAAEIAAFWQEMHHDFPKAPMVGRKAKGLEPLWNGIGKMDASTLTITASQKSLDRLAGRARRLNAGIATALFSGYLEGLCQCYDLDQLMFVTHSARSDPALDTYMGDHTLDPIIRYRAANGAGMDQTMTRLSASLMAMIAHLPSECARRGTPYEAALIADGCYGGQFSAYQPRAQARQERSMFKEGFNTSHGVEQRLGPYVLSSLDVVAPKRCLTELQFSLENKPVRTGFRLKYDQLGYDAKEIRELAAKICDLLELDLTDMVLQ